MAGFIQSTPFFPRRLALAAGEKLGGVLFRAACRKGNGAMEGRKKKRRCFIDLSFERSLDDMTRAFGDTLTTEEKTEMIRSSYHHAGRSLIEALRIPKLPRSKLLAAIDAEPLDPIYRVLDRGKGVIILTPHLGTWEILASYLVHNLDRPFSAIAQQQRFAPYDSMLKSIRSQGAGLNIIQQDSGPRPLLKALRRNEPVVILGDLDMPKLQGVFVDFFGRPAYTPVGPAALARVSGAGMLPMFIRWKPGSGTDECCPRHHAHFEPEIDLVHTSDRAADNRENTQRWTRAIEGIIRRYPEQWIWFHRRWRTQADSEDFPPLHEVQRKRRA